MFTLTLTLVLLGRVSASANDEFCKTQPTFIVSHNDDSRKATHPLQVWVFGKQTGTHPFRYGISYVGSFRNCQEIRDELKAIPDTHVPYITMGGTLLPKPHFERSTWPPHFDPQTEYPEPRWSAVTKHFLRRWMDGIATV